VSKKKHHHTIQLYFMQTNTSKIKEESFDKEKI